MSKWPWVSRKQLDVVIGERHAMTALANAQSYRANDLEAKLARANDLEAKLAASKATEQAAMEEPFKHWAQDPSMPLTLQSLADRVAQLEAHCAHLDAQLKGPPGKA